MYFTGSPSCNFGYYNYIYIWPYYIVIHMYVNAEILYKPCLFDVQIGLSFILIVILICQVHDWY